MIVTLYGNRVFADVIEMQIKMRASWIRALAKLEEGKQKLRGRGRTEGSLATTGSGRNRDGFFPAASKGAGLWQHLNFRFLVSGSVRVNSCRGKAPSLW